MSFFIRAILGLKSANGHTFFVDLYIIENILFSYVKNRIPLDAGKASYAGSSEPITPLPNGHHIIAVIGAKPSPSRGLYLRQTYPPPITLHFQLFLRPC